MSRTPFRERTSSRVLEFFVVLSVISVISSVGFTLIASAGSSARDAARMGDIANIRKALHFYYAEHGEYPATGWINSGDESWRKLVSELSPYTSYVPVDPKNERNGVVYHDGAYNYGYFSSNDPNTIGGEKDYILFFRAEDDEHIQNFRSHVDVLVDNVGVGITPYPIDNGMHVYAIRAPQ